jgi:ferric enterobactin receptor
MKKLLLIIGLFSFFLMNTIAQKNLLTGVVKNSENGETLPSASIVIKGTSLGTTTNVDGFFTLLDLPSEQFTLNVFYMGYHPVLLDVDLSKVKGRLVIEMQPSSIEIDEVLVSSKSYKMIKATETVSAIRVAPIDLTSLPSFGEVDIFRSLQLLPGISGTNENSSGLFVRGGTPDQNLVLLDGMTVFNVDHFFGFFSAFNADAIKDIQLYKGGYPAKYGGRIASVVDLTGKSGDPNNFHMNGGVNLLDAHTTIELPFKNKGSVLFSIRRSYSDFLESNLYNKIYDMLSQNSSEQGTQSTAGATSSASSGSTGGPAGGGGPGGGPGGFANLPQPTVTTVRPTFYFYDLNGKITYHPTEKDNVSLSIYSGKDNLYKNSENNRDIVFNNDQSLNRSVINSQTENTDWGNFGFSFKWSRQWSPKLYSNLMSAYSNYFSNYNQSTINQTKDKNADTLIDNRIMGNLEKNDVKEISFRLDNEWQFSSTHQLGFGVNLSNVKTSYNFVRDDTLKVLNKNETGLLSSLYLQDIWKVTSKFEINAGLRTNWYNITRKIYIEPRFSFKYAPTAYLTLKGATGKYNQYVNRIINENVTEGSRDFWLMADNELVNVQSSWHYIFGASFENKNFLFDVEAYYKTLVGLSEFSLRYRRNNIELDKLFFQGHGTAKGIEFLLQKKLGQITGWVTYTLSKVEHQFDGLNNGNPFPALHDQTHEIKAVTNWEPTKKWRFSVTWVYGSGKPYTSPEARYQIDLLDGRQFSYISVGPKNGERLPAYHRMDVAAHYLFKIKKVNMDAGFSIFNLYNRTNIWYRQFNLQQLPMVVTDVTYLGVTPNASLNFSF